jgi:hypothetical protein
MRWVDTPTRDGWYWHRYFVEGRPVYNTCYVMKTGGHIFVHYLGDTEQLRFQRSIEDMYWGPLEPPT